MQTQTVLASVSYPESAHGAPLKARLAWVTIRLLTEGVRDWKRSDELLVDGNGGFDVELLEIGISNFQSAHHLGHRVAPFDNHERRLPDILVDLLRIEGEYGSGLDVDVFSNYRVDGTQLYVFSLVDPELLAEASDISFVPVGRLVVLARRRFDHPGFAPGDLLFAGHPI